MSKKFAGEYYLGLDIGTDSVGWAVTDNQYNVLKFNGKSMWGIRLFDAAQTAAERRMFRTARRRVERRRWRLELLQELFQNEIEKKDPDFFQRMKDSALYPEDSKTGKPFALFCDKDLNDKLYYKQYPTIYHLRKALLTENSKFDIRLVYLAIHHILKHRGHFLFNGDFSNVTRFSFAFEQLQTCLCNELDMDFECNNVQKLSEILKDTHMSKNDKVKASVALFENSGDKKQLQAVIGLFCGAKKKLADVFLDETLNDTEMPSISIADKPYEELRPELESILAEKCCVIDYIKAVYDWAILADMLDGGEYGNRTYISVARVRQYEKHHDDLKKLKKLVRRYCKSEYKSFFSFAGTDNYCAYIGDDIETDDRKSVKKCKQEDFYKRIKGLLKKAIENGCPKDEVVEIIKDIDAQVFLPLQVTKDNGVIPHQVHEMELKQILKNAEKYYPFLCKKDEEGIVTSNKILQLFKFRIPYYVGPLNSRIGKNSWIVRRAEGKIYPWNFEEKVDLDKSEEGFIRRMTNPCTYMAGADVLPKYSLLYSEFMVLNELNNVRICGDKLSVEIKQTIIKDLFQRTRRVTVRKLCDKLKAEGVISRNSNQKDIDIKGIDQDLKSSMVSYIDFKNIFGKEIEKYSVQQMCERIIFLLTIHHDDKRRLQKRIRAEFTEAQITDDQLQKVLRLNYQGWGRFSAEFLKELKGVDTETGEVFSIINALRKTDDNLMQLLSNRYTFSEELEKYNSNKRKKIEALTYDNIMEGIVASPAIKRSAWQAISIVMELSKIMGREPKRIFVEMARGPEEKKHTISRKNQLLELYKSVKDESRDWKTELETKTESDFRSIKLFLYYTQMGRCMYTGEPIDLDQLANTTIYDRDHIYPQSLTKDDSLNNLVLVKKVENANKGNGLISADIQKKMRGFWAELKKKGLISDEKFSRLTRTTPLSDDELAGFINRQLVETRQSSKIVADLFHQLYPTTQVVYVKAKIVSDFRHETLDMVKVRSLNDLHHAKDAYLNIVTGNVYYEKFSGNPLTWLRKNPDRNYSLNQMFNYDIVKKTKEGTSYVWKKGKDGSIAVVRRTMERNDILYTRQATENKNGGLFDQNIVSSKNKPFIPVKKGLDVNKYGGYKGITPAYFALIEFTDKKGSRQRLLEAVPLYLRADIDNDSNVLRDFYKNVLGLENPVVILNRIKKNSLLKINGFLIHLRGTTGFSASQLKVQNAVEFSLPHHMEDYVKKLENYEKHIIAERGSKKISQIKITEWDGISKEKNLQLYDMFINKMENTIYKFRPANQVANLKENREVFNLLAVEDQCSVLNQILMLFVCKPVTANLSLIKGSKNAGNMALSKIISNMRSAYLIHQSVTGLFEQKIDLLKVSSQKD